MRAPRSVQHGARDAQLLAPVGPALSLTDTIVARLIEEIGSGRRAPGDRLPTEQEMMASMGVSRTVVREAISALKAQGFVTTRQGSGAFVATTSAKRGFYIDPAGLGSLDKVLQVLELRLAVEVEAAGLASMRSTRTELRALAKRLDDIDAAIERGEAAIAEDFAFHTQIARLTGNAQFVDFLSFLGQFVIPRQVVRIEGMTPDRQSAYLRVLQIEHKEIFAAVDRHDRNSAQHAMRTHLTRSIERYRRLLRTQPTPSV